MTFYRGFSCHLSMPRDRLIETPQKVVFNSLKMLLLQMYLLYNTRKGSHMFKESEFEKG